MTADHPSGIREEGEGFVSFAERELFAEFGAQELLQLFRMLVAVHAPEKHGCCCTDVLDPTLTAWSGHGSLIQTLKSLRQARGLHLLEGSMDCNTKVIDSGLTHNVGTSISNRTIVRDPNVVDPGAMVGSWRKPAVAATPLAQVKSGRQPYPKVLEKQNNIRRNWGAGLPYQGADTSMSALIESHIEMPHK